MHFYDANKHTRNKLLGLLLFINFEIFSEQSHIYVD